MAKAKKTTKTSAKKKPAVKKSAAKSKTAKKSKTTAAVTKKKASAKSVGNKKKTKTAKSPLKPVKKQKEAPVKKKVITNRPAVLSSTKLHAPKPKKIMSENQGEKTRYSDEELKEFYDLISNKLDKAKKELTFIMESLTRKNDPGTDTTAGTLKLLEDGADTTEKENLTQLAARQQKYVQNLENAIARIKNGTYGICIDTGKLIPKERLRAVPHTQHSIEAKLNRKN